MVDEFARFATVLKWETEQLRPDCWPAELEIEQFGRAALSRSDSLKARRSLDAGREGEQDETALNAVYRILADLEAKTGRPRTALCLSGGGIRSATFALGVIQALARIDRLDFDYLSTVSGGGYIGSWLSAWIRHEADKIVEAGNAADKGRDPTPLECREALRTIQSKLREYQGTSVEAESPPVEYLREYSNYLSPRLGLLSADTWSLIATYVRNLLLNWLVILPCVALALLVPQLCVIFAPEVGRGWIPMLALGAGTLLIGLAISYISVDLPSGDPPRPRGQGDFLVRFLFPLGAGGALLAAYWFSNGPDSSLPWQRFAIYGALVHLGGAICGRIWLASERHAAANPTTVGAAVASGPRQASLRRRIWNVAAPLAIVAFAGGFAGLLLYWVTVSARGFHDSADWTRLVVLLALPVMLQVYAIATTLYVGLISRFRTEHDREWWSRQVGWLYIASVGWLVFAGTSLFGDRLLGSANNLLVYVGGLSGLATWILGRSAVTAAGRKGDSAAAGGSLAAMVGMIGVERLAQIAALVFGIFLLAVIGQLDVAMRDGLPALLEAADIGRPESVTGSDLQPLVVGAQVAVLLLAALIASWAININRFSLHAMYRNRLVRAYLGASRGRQRQAHPFTGFDPGDDLAMARLALVRPFHVVNMTLNLVKGARLAWQHRKAESFTVSPLHCGSAASSNKDGGGLGYRPTVRYGRDRDTGDGISLGTAMAISGAAASPNMGYNSSPLVTFVMTLFNARLGWWLGNPAQANAAVWQSDGPRFSARPIFAEAFGLTDDESPYVYLSDGGHFENLGLYEMVLRRCRTIVVVDGSCDPEYCFEDLGNAVRKIRIDLGVEIDFGGELDVLSDARRRRCCYVATIGYAERDGCGRDGTLIYLKPAIGGDEPADVLEYQRTHERFPHETTVDQWFSEPQFESYRMLGIHSVTRAARDLRRLAEERHREAASAVLLRATSSPPPPIVDAVADPATNGAGAADAVPRNG